jgi:hypothetical protein
VSCCIVTVKEFNKDSFGNFIKIANGETFNMILCTINYFCIKGNAVETKIYIIYILVGSVETIRDSRKFI